MEHAARVSTGQGSRFVHGLAKCVRVDSTLSAEEKKAWEIAKDRGQQLYAPENGGRYEIFNERPLKEDIKVYCQQDVLCLPNLHKVYRSKLACSGFSNWSIQVRQQTEKRLEESTSEHYQPNGAHKTHAPQWEKRTDRWKELDDWDDDRDDYQDWEEDMEENGSPY
jgi:exonuclease 3'-5' domain-containing protein 1